MKNINDLKKEYMDIKIPENLDDVVKESIKKVDRKSIVNKKIIGSAAVLAIVFGINISPAFADVVSDIPIVGNIVKLVTVKNYTLKKNNVEADIKVPAIESLENKQLEENLNEEFIENGKKIYEELIEEFPSINNQMKYVGSDYKIKADNDSFLSIEIIKEEIQASSYTTKKHYTIDKNKQIVLTLPMLFEGDNYIEEISNDIKAQMIENMKKDSNLIYFLEADENEEVIDSFDKIKENQDFYINNDGNLVICFDQYEVAPGYMGTLEFIISDKIFKK
ncbi:RsiV family protein [Clostridium butyricum]|uniref:RsiV family protein n=1 Tax=Clostridium butyricum TaxID=1492 RepID=UPI0034664900